jgi:hypothetical protein
MLADRRNHSGLSKNDQVAHESQNKELALEEKKERENLAQVVFPKPKPSVKVNQKSMTVDALLVYYVCVATGDIYIKSHDNLKYYVKTFKTCYHI